jgi:hypothetical protein
MKYFITESDNEVISSVSSNFEALRHILNRTKRGTSRQRRCSRSTHLKDMPGEFICRTPETANARIEYLVSRRIELAQIARRLGYRNVAALRKAIAKLRPS